MYPIYIERGKALPLDIDSSSRPSLFVALAMPEESWQTRKELPDHDPFQLQPRQFWGINMLVVSIPCWQDLSFDS
jgi:hypothetical protein